MKKKLSIGSGIIREIFGKWVKLEFPKNYRLITAIILSLSLATLISLISLDLTKNLLEKQKIEEERQKLVSEVRFWQGVVGKYKDYRDAYFQLATLEYQLKNFDKARVYLRKVLEIDPNFEQGRKLEKLLSVQP